MIRPTDNFVIIKPIAQTTSHGGIILPTKCGELGTAAVVAVGPGSIDNNGCRIPTECGVYDNVLFLNDHGFELNIEGEKHLLIRADAIVGIIE